MVAGQPLGGGGPGRASIWCPTVPPTLSAEQIRDANTRYHDVAAGHYDSKWGIDFGEIGRAQVLAKVRKALGREPSHWRRSLEIGAGTGYFTLNLMAAGLIGEATCTDISPGMLRTLSANAERLGVEVERRSPTPSVCRSRTRASTSSSATPCSITSPTCPARSANSSACSPRAGP